MKPHGAKPKRVVEVPGAALRADAARALARIAFDGISLRGALADVTPRIGDARDRALLAALLFSAARWWLRFDAALAAFLERPLPAKAREVRALLVIGMTELAVLEHVQYAVVASCVDAARALGHPHFAGLVNAVLRRFLRERGVLDLQLDADPVARVAHPGWLIDAISHDWPQHAEAILAADNHEAPLTLRVNRRRGTREALLERLAAAQIDAAAQPDVASAIVLGASTDVTGLPGYTEGLFSVQDAAAQRVADLIEPQPGMRVLDACAAPGGKAAHILENAAVELIALDRDPARLPRVHQNLARLGLQAQVVAGDATTVSGWWDGRHFDRILVDAPCSATGIVRRQPDIKLHRRQSDIAPLARMQTRLLNALWPLLAPRGCMVYTTCSILRKENEAVLAAFLHAHDDARALPPPATYGHVAGGGRQNLPGEAGMDGFYYAILEKKN